MRHGAWFGLVLTLAACSSTSGDNSHLTLNDPTWDRVTVELVITKRADCDSRGDGAAAILADPALPRRPTEPGRAAAAAADRARRGDFPPGGGPARRGRAGNIRGRAYVLRAAGQLAARQPGQRRRALSALSRHL